MDWLDGHTQSRQLNVQVNTRDEWRSSRAGVGIGTFNISDTDSGLSEPQQICQHHRAVW